MSEAEDARTIDLTQTDDINEQLAALLLTGIVEIQASITNPLIVLLEGLEKEGLVHVVEINYNEIELLYQFAQAGEGGVVFWGLHREVLEGTPRIRQYLTDYGWDVKQIFEIPDTQYTDPIDTYRLDRALPASE
jgi:hypothetical protein